MHTATCYMSCVFTLLLLHVVQANIIIKTGNYTFDPLDDMPADFGPRIPAEGLEGFLIAVDPLTACTKLQVPVSPVVAWVALIQRSEGHDEQCTFDIKVQNAQDAGAMAAIVYDNEYEPLIVMSKPVGHPDPAIPAVFVAQKTGVVMQKFLTTGTVTVRIIQINEAIWVSMMMSAMAGVIAVTLMIAIFYCVRRRRGFGPLAQAGYQPLDGCTEGMTPEQMRALPIVIAEKRGRRSGSDGSDYSFSGSDDSPKGPKGGGTLKTCAICLEDYKDGEKLRVLPCNHRFHTECIDQWLSSRKPLCPVCKHDALRPFGVEEAEAQEQEQAEHDESNDSPHPEHSLPPFFFPIRRWRRRWQWGAGSSHTHAETDLSTAPVDIEQPAVAANDVGASSSSSHNILNRTAAGSAELGSTPVNFPGMHYSRFAAPVETPDSPMEDTEITPVSHPDSMPLLHHSEDTVEASSSLPAVRSHFRRPGRARLAGSLPARPMAHSPSAEPMSEASELE